MTLAILLSNVSSRSRTKMFSDSFTCKFKVLIVIAVNLESSNFMYIIEHFLSTRFDPFMVLMARTSIDTRLFLFTYFSSVIVSSR